MQVTFSTLAIAAPELKLRDRIDIQLDPIRRIDGSVLVKGRLISRGTGDGAPYLSLRLQLDTRWVTVLTDGKGYFSERFAATEGEHLLSVDVDDSEFLDAAHFEMADFDIHKRPLALRLEAPAELADTSPELSLQLGATSEGVPIALELGVFLGGTGEDLKLVARVRTGNAGEATLLIPQEQLGAPGRKRLEVRFAGDDSLDAATTSGQFKITSSSALTLEVSGDNFDYGDVIPVSGRLEDGRGEAIVNAVITLEVQSQRIASTKTDERGDFRLKIDSEELGSGSAVALQAHFRPSEAWKEAARSAPITIQIGERKPIPLSIALAAFVVTALGLLSFVGLRARPWERWRKSTGPAEERADDEEEPELPPPTGLAAGRPRLSNTFRKPHYRDLEGVVHDTMNKKPIDMARIELTGPSPQVMQTNAKGGFRSATLHAGEHLVRISADGYVSEEFRIVVPHKGEFHNTTIALLPVREKIFAIYKAALRPRLPDPKLWGIWTPRQILDHVRSSRPNEELSALTDFVEESVFSQRSPHEDVLPHARALVGSFTKEEPARPPRP